MLAGLLLAGALAAPGAAGEVYKWVDDDGVTHYSQSPPTSDARPLATPSRPSDAAIGRARDDLDALLQRQARRDAARIAQRRRDAQEAGSTAAHRRDLALGCANAQRLQRLLRRQRPVFLLNHACQRVYVADADRRDMLALLETVVPGLCRADPARALDAATQQRVDRLLGIQDRHRATPGEPLGYPDFSDRDLRESPDFCRCAERFLAEMREPRFRTPRSAIAAARDQVGAICGAVP